MRMCFAAALLLTAAVCACADYTASDLRADFARGVALGGEVYARALETSARLSTALATDDGRAVTYTRRQLEQMREGIARASGARKASRAKEGSAPTPSELLEMTEGFEALCRRMAGGIIQADRARQERLIGLLVEMLSRPENASARWYYLGVAELVVNAPPLAGSEVVKPLADLLPVLRSEAGARADAVHWDFARAIAQVPQAARSFGAALAQVTGVAADALGSDAAPAAEAAPPGEPSRSFWGRVWDDITQHSRARWQAGARIGAAVGHVVGAIAGGVAGHAAGGPPAIVPGALAGAKTGEAVGGVAGGALGVIGGAVGTAAGWMLDSLDDRLQAGDGEAEAVP